MPNTVFYNCQQAPKEARSAAAALCKHWALALREDPKYASCTAWLGQSLEQTEPHHTGLVSAASRALSWLQG